MLVYHFADTKTEFSGNDTYLGTLAFQCFQYGNRFRKKESVVFPMVRFMASSLMPVCPWRSSTLRKQITMPREESASV